ncbi:MAG: hypothetical protein M5R36_14250 [Deltaproteobacteria bacterium]|nr:hypothetical protein [Deltaproteobacteria bacterium]
MDFNLQDGNNGIKIGNDGAAYVYFNDKEAGDPTKPQYVDHYFMKFENSDWSILTSFEGNLISWNNEPANRKFALDSSNRGYLFFSRPRKEFVIVEDGYAEEFTILTLNSDGSLSATALDIDGAGRLYFGYHYDYYVGVSVKDGEAWIEHIAFETGEGSLSKLDMKVDSDSAIHLVIAHDDLLYVTNRTGDWTEETLPESGGRDVELELSSAGEPTVIRSSDRSSGYVTISRRDATAEWTNEKVDAGFGEVVGASAALDSTDAVHISHYMYGGKDGSGDAPLLYTTNASGTWVTEEIDR